MDVLSVNCDRCGSENTLYTQGLPLSLAVYCHSCREPLGTVRELIRPESLRAPPITTSDRPEGEGEPG